MNSNKTVRNLLPAVFALVVFLLFASNPAGAAVNICSDQQGVTIIPGNYATDSANLVSVGSSCTALCGTYKRAYVEFTDKELFALIMSAVMKNQKVNLVVENAAPQKGSSYHGSYTCKVMSAWVTGGI